jgi:DNA-binding response OmpR family regulator
MPVNLLIVQQEPPVASFIKRGLEAEGFVVQTACDGAEGLKLSKSPLFDLIVLDLVLPTVTGEEILTRLRAAGSSVPVIVLTASDAIPDRVATLNAGRTTTSRDPAASPNSSLASGRDCGPPSRRSRPRSRRGASRSTW